MVQLSVKKIVIILIIFLVVVGVAYRMSVFRITENFYEVDSGKLYRSAQLSSDELNEYIKKYQIKTVLSLRGYPPTQILSYDTNEIENLPKMNVKFIPVDLDDNYYPSKEDVKKIMQALTDGPYPILIHCRVGSDRTGMVSAMYEKFVKGKSNEEALDQLRFKYWHVRKFRPAMSEFVRKVVDKDWLMNQYNECLPEFSDLRNPEHVCK